MKNNPFIAIGNNVIKRISVNNFTKKELIKHLKSL